jgi:hypothetical protein
LEGLGRPGPGAPTTVATVVIEHGKVVEGEQA